MLLEGRCMTAGLTTGREEKGKAFAWEMRATSQFKRPKIKGM